MSSWSSGQTHCLGGSSHSYCENTWVRTTVSPSACANGYYQHFTNHDSQWFCSFLQRFRPKMRESVQSFTGSSLQRREAWSFTAVSMPAITAFWSAQSTKINPKTFSGGVRLSQLFQLFCHKQTNCYLIVHPNQSIKLSELQVISLCIPVLFLPRVETPGETHFSPPMFMKESFLNKNVCLRATNKRRSDHGSCTSVFRQYSQFSCIIFELGGSDGFSWNFHFPHKFVFLNHYEKKLVHPLS